MARLGSVLLLLLAGCSGKDDDTTPTFGGAGDDDDQGEETADTAGQQGPAPKLATELRFKGFVAWDAGLGQVVDPVIDGEDNVSGFEISLYESGWTDDDEDSHCVVVVLLAGTPLATEDVQTEGFLWGIDIPGGLDDKETYTDCLDKGFDESQFTDGDPIAAWAAHDWQLRFGSEVTPDLADWLTPDTTTADFDITWFTGGGFSSESAGITTDPDENYWYAYAMDGDHNVDFDTHLTTPVMTNGNGEPATAYFIFDQRIYYNLEPDTGT